MLTFRKRMLFSGGGLLVGFTALFFLFLDRLLNNLCKQGIPVDEICSLVSKCKISILILGGGFLFLYLLSTWILFNRLSRPLQKITDHILSYTEGNLFPLIELESVEKGEFAKIASILNAMTKKIKQQMDHLKLSRIETVEILESLNEGVISVDVQGKTTFANKSACKIFGVSSEAILNGCLHQIDAVRKDLALKCYEAIQDVLQTSESISQNWDDGKRDKTHLELTAAPRPGQRGAILVLKDKSADFKMLEMGKDFIANASHELRTPITIIRGFAETLHDHPELARDTLQEISGKIMRTSHRLEHLVKSLLTLADIENFSLDQHQKTDLIPIAEHCKQLAMSAYRTSQIALMSGLDNAEILGDPQLLDLAVTNLLENAVKYSPSPAHITMSIWKRDGEVQLLVQDKGIGIAEAEIPHIFERFYTVDKARSRKSGGAGLGLSIVKTIVEKHRGTVSVSSQPGFGSTFTICLPLKNG